MEKYLQLLLKEVNTVIIPGLGTLTITNQSTGETMFMPYLKYDDGKLSAYISEKEGCTVDEAKNLINQKVQLIAETVENNKSYAIGDLGCFTKDSIGEIQFVDKVDMVSQTNQDIPVSIPVETKDKISTPEVSSLNIPSAPTQETPIADRPVSEIPEIEKPKKKGFFGMFKKDKAVHVESDEVSSLPQEDPIIKEINEEVAEDKIEDNIPVEIQERKENIIVEETADKSIVDENTTRGNEGIETEELIETDEISLEIVDEMESVAPIEVIATNEEVRILEKEAEENIIEEVVAPSEVSEVKENVESQNNQIGNEGNDDAEESEIMFQKVKKKRGVGFWILMSVIVIIVGGGTFVGLNFDKYKQYLPFMSDKTKTLKADESTIIKELESDKTKPSTDESSSSKEMIETPEEASVESSIPVDEPTPVPTTSIPKKKHVNSTSQSSSSSIPSASVTGGEYHIVLATFSEKTNADSYVVKLVSEGNSSATLIERDGKFSVCFGSYSSNNDAKSNLSKAKEISSNAWILHKP